MALQSPSHMQNSISFLTNENSLEIGQFRSNHNLDQLDNLEKDTSHKIRSKKKTSPT